MDGFGPIHFYSTFTLPGRGGRLEVVSHADGRAEDVPPLVGDKNGITESWYLGDQAAVLGADIEAGADLIGNAGSVDGADFGDLFHVQRLRARVAHRLKEEGPRAGFDKRIPFLIVELAHVTGGDLHGAGRYLHPDGKLRKHVFDRVLVSDTVVDFKRTGRGEHEAVAGQGTQLI